MKFVNTISRINIAISSGSGLATGAMMVVIIIDVIGRAFFSTPMPLATEALHHPVLARLSRRISTAALPPRLWTCAGPQLADAVSTLAEARRKIDSR